MHNLTFGAASRTVSEHACGPCMSDTVPAWRLGCQVLQVVARKGRRVGAPADTQALAEHGRPRTAPTGSAARYGVRRRHPAPPPPPPMPNSSHDPHGPLAPCRHRPLAHMPPAPSRACRHRLSRAPTAPTHPTRAPTTATDHRHRRAPHRQRPPSAAPPVTLSDVGPFNPIRTDQEGARSDGNGRARPR